MRSAPLKRPLAYLVIVAVAAALLIPDGNANARKVQDDNKGTKLLREVKRPEVVFRKIEKAWRSSKADVIAGLVGGGRVYIVMGGKGREGGYYSKAQVYYLMKKMFKEYRQMKFEFVKYHNVDKPGRKVFAIAYRNYKNIRSGKVFQDKVYITLGKEGDDWVLVEIKTTR